jgi:hypothetical protein
MQILKYGRGFLVLDGTNPERPDMGHNFMDPVAGVLLVRMQSHELHRTTP